MLIYVGNANGNGLVEKEVEGEVYPAAILSALVQEKVLPEGVSVKEFHISEGDKSGILNLTGLNTDIGSQEEALFLAAVGNTFTKAFQLDKLRLLVDGQNYTSGHVEFTDKDYLTYNQDYQQI
ncbi:hypothetical protein FACS189418_9240 [Clostridia bacterium]|nr:hypothetical protein FACS189418_9240 [Clostridia bacterium]